MSGSKNRKLEKLEKAINKIPECEVATISEGRILTSQSNTALTDDFMQEIYNMILKEHSMETTKTTTKTTTKAKNMTQQQINNGSDQMEEDNQTAAGLASAAGAERTSNNNVTTTQQHHLTHSERSQHEGTNFGNYQQTHKMTDDASNLNGNMNKSGDWSQNVQSYSYSS